MKPRILKEQFFKFISYLAGATTVLILIVILGQIFMAGLPSLNFQFIVTPESEAKGLGGGIANGIAGTILLSFFSTILATPIAVGTSIYLKKYAKEGRMVRTLRFMIDVLSGTPSIVLAIFGLMVLVIYMRYLTGGFSLIAGSIGLAILILPVIERSAEEAIETVPHELEEASYALGANKWDTIRLITIPYSMTGIITGVVLGLGRAAEESAVVILTAGNSQFMPMYKVVPDARFIFGVQVYPLQFPVGSLPLLIYKSYQSPHLIPISEGFGAAFVLIMIVMLINLTTKLLLWRRRIG
ncbi:phosphate ABC transporter permease PstA [Methanolobus sediminis]|uniref:Phosphate transport system permease protein PstA n=1 Tax=Methanolobus sediminis TaxID=3072978 RepID=A0AA51UK64_9EURY|nr:phosphate ABC transporter permease PstA [Methanolobus sediminis]WMW24915.1 phosphate ABC transporter permease PstA [Methanolobus sediminis]